jgi:hypothetical protein
MSFPTPHNHFEHQILDKIEKHGFAHIFVSASETAPSFCYTLGLTKNFNHPELIIVGLPQEVSGGILNVIGRAAIAGNPVDMTKPSDQVLKGFSALFGEVVDPVVFENYTSSAGWLNQGQPYKLYQVIWPDNQGLFPWNEKASEPFKRTQTLLCEGAFTGINPQRDLSSYIEDPEECDVCSPGKGHGSFH